MQGNELIEGQSELAAYAAHIQKGGVDKLKPEDLVSMGVDKEKIQEDLKYDDMLVPMSAHYDRSDSRRLTSKSQIANVMGTSFHLYLGRPFY